MKTPLSLAASFLVLLASSALAIEPWADPDLPAKEGVLLWLDAARQPAAWQAHKKPPLHNGAAVDVWYDGSGIGRHLVQRLQASQPRFVRAGTQAVVRFDGKDDSLALSGQNRTLDKFTVFFVAAPRSNAGDFRAFLAVNATGKNDYTTGFTIDMTGEGSTVWDRLNVEGHGFMGARSIARAAFPFADFHVVEVQNQVGPGGVALFVDGRRGKRRDREPGTLRMDDVTVGARFYSNTSEPPALRGFLDGDVTEVLIYDRLLADAERQATVDYLRKKHAGLTQALATGRILRPVLDPPPVQMLVPGFTVKQLPIDLTNINNLKYRVDGKLVALAYNGNVYLLADTDGDGVEDKADLFWDSKDQLKSPIGMALTPPGYRHGNGLFVAANGKVSLIVDTDGDDKADKEIIVAEGWKSTAHGVDAIGVALDQAGNVYFGIGVEEFGNAYLLDKQGVSRYDLNTERGTIQKVSADFRKRETFARGIRFPVALAFDRHGELFATDQEGATWMPNGNPFDELLHIQPGRFYGFPPRHPKHLPNVIDEPSVFDYAPQHQSTCGLNFNESGFGPAWWAGDAIVAGSSRGKLYRTQLARTPTGYVAQNHLIGCLNMLTIDACVSPKGALVVACHSGPPDWGTGPTGKGKLYKIFYRPCPQPVLAWSPAPREVRIAFDQPLEPNELRDLSRKLSIEYGATVRPGDRFESFRPGYVVVAHQQTQPRHDLSVLSARLSGDRRTLQLITAPQSEAAYYAVTMPGVGRSPSANGAEKQAPEIDLGYELTGVAAAFQPASEGTEWTGWLPHLDLAGAKTFTVASAEHETLWKLLEQPGKLTMRTQLDLWQMLRPAVQPGSRIDWTPPPEKVAITLAATQHFEVKAPSARGETQVGKDAKYRVTLHVQPKDGEWLPLEISVTKPAGSLTFDVTYSTHEDARPRALPLRRLLLPWAAKLRQPPATPEPPRELAGGDWQRGREVFHSDQAQCARCHQVRGDGGRIGPDLSNLVHRDYASVMRDLRDPSAAINPDYLPSVVELKDGRVLTGVPRTDGDRIILGDQNGKETILTKTQIEKLSPSPVSIMPKGIDQQLGPDKLRDLLTFLLVDQLKPAPIEAAGFPPPRPRAELDAVLKGGPPAAGPRKRLHIVLVAGKKDHGPGEHDYPLWQRRWLNLFGMADDVRVGEAMDWPTKEQLATADVLVFNSANPAWSAAKAGDLDAFLERGGGLVYLHFAVNGGAAPEALADRIGLAWGKGSKFRHGPLDLTFPDPKHPITQGFAKTQFVDESYWNLKGDPKKIHVLASGVEEGEPRPLMWTHEKGRGRVFVSILGHFSWTFDDPLFRMLVLRGLAWTAREPVDRFNSLATVGARVGE